MWSKMPFVRILIPFIVGILAYRAFPTEFTFNSILFIVIAILTLLAAWLFIFKSLISYSIRFVQSILLLVCVLCIGYLVAYNNDIRNKGDFIGYMVGNEPVEMILKINNEVEQKKNNMKTAVSALAFKSDTGWEQCSGKILLYIANQDSQPKLNYGDIIVAKIYLNSVQEPLFNSDFNYKKFLANKNIYHQSYVREYAVLERNCGNKIIAFALNVRNKIADILEKGLGSNDEFGVVSAMLTGYRADISADMMRAYSGAGVIHIMSVSGLHVGVIYIMITAFIGLFGFLQKRKVLNVVIVLVLIWFYATLTGLSASVLRSAVMISFVVIGTAMNRTISSYNSLAAAAFVLLAFNAGTLGEIGFQLSFLAVLGILLFQRPIYNLLNVNNKWLDKIWQLACVSIAAQLITLPLILFYFGQFPVYFLISNILVVPLSSLILYLGMATVLLSWVPFLSDVMIFITLWATKIMNFIVTYIESLPFAIISNIYIYAIVAVILFVVLCLFYLMFTQKRFKLIYPIFILSILAIFTQWNFNFKNSKSQAAFYIKDGQSYIVGVKHEKTVYLTNSSATNEVSPYLVSRLQTYLERNSLKAVILPDFFNDSTFYKNEQFLAWKNYKMLTWMERKMPQNAHLLPNLDVMLAPNLSKYYFQKQNENLPIKKVMSKIKDESPSLINISNKREMIIQN